MSININPFELRLEPIQLLSKQKQDKLISGINIKTINEESILGKGNINIDGNGVIDSLLSEISTNAILNKVVTEAIKLINAQKELTLTVKDNGNIVIGNLQGQTKEFMPATPSGDPMFYAYIVAGAEYLDLDGKLYTNTGTTNHTPGANITKTAPWGEAVTHKAGHYYLNGLGDITKEEMTAIYNTGKVDNLNMIGRYYKTNIRTNLPTTIAIKGDEGLGNYSLAGVCNSSNQLQVILLNNTSILHVSNSFYGAFSNCPNLEYIYPVLNVKNCTVTNALSSFYNCHKLKHIELKDVKMDLNLSYCSNIFKSSILYIIQNATPSSAITIKLHPEAYARLAEDADILAELAKQPSVSLSK